MITATSRSATISLFRSARRITPVVPTGVHGWQRRWSVASVGSDDQPGAGRNVHERRRRAWGDEDLARTDDRPADLRERGDAIQPGRVDAVLGHRVRSSRRPRRRPRRPVPRGGIDAVPPAQRLRRRRRSPAGARATVSWSAISPMTASAKSARSSGRSSWICTSSIARVGARNPPPTDPPPKDGMTSATMSSMTTATLDAARRAGHLVGEAAAVERDAQVPLGRHERDPDVGLSGPANVVVGDHVRGICRSDVRSVHTARAVSESMHSSNPPDVRRTVPRCRSTSAARNARSASTTSSASSACGPLDAVSQPKDAHGSS